MTKLRLGRQQWICLGWLIEFGAWSRQWGAWSHGTPGNTERLLKSLEAHGLVERHEAEHAAGGTFTAWKATTAGTRALIAKRSGPAR